ncbi:MAG: 1-deoxy-D-xylulose-5-phosphate reductoisomerase [Clostridia bacterium]|nr:1-deoxy-D-xylulose-5-phosphate reductoisomerase [Clostridia bacterium]
MKKLAILGSTGSIGTQTLNVVRRNQDKYKVVSLSAGFNEVALLNQVKEFSPTVVTLGDSFKNPSAFGGATLFSGKDAYLNAITDDVDLVVVALVGFDGLKAVLKAIELKKDVALATKEALVVGGALVMDYANKNGVKITPIDSEHSAIWQALNFDFSTPFRRIILTASGGAFRDNSYEEMAFLTAKDALKHPNWQMGNKITIDCATLVNKGFEVIEAKWLYNTDFDKIDAIIHRESIIHSMVEFYDNSIIAQLSYPTMEIPIALALDSTVRLPSNAKPIDFTTLKNLSFDVIDGKKFPCFDLVVSAGKLGGLYPAVVNGANEVAVEAFIKGQIKYNDIYAILNEALNAYKYTDKLTLESIFNADSFAREYAKNYILRK